MKLSMFMAACLLVGAAEAATGMSNEVRLDFRGMGPWERRVARPTETIQYSTVWATNAPAGAKTVVKVYPCLKEKPKYIAIDLSGGTNATHYPIEYLDEIPGGSWSDEYKTSKLVLRHIPAGSFIMGGRNTDYPGAVNTNLHMVTITRDFYMGVFEVTQRQWELVMGTRPSAFTNATCYATRPVDSTSYNMIRGSVKGSRWPQSTDVDEDSFMGIVRRKTALTGFDLPTSSQWEYACRAGTDTALNSGENLSEDAACVEMDRCARYKGNSMVDGHEWWDSYYRDKTTVVATAKVGSYLPNRWGLYDMHGNVFDTCLDWWSPSVPAEGVDPVGAPSGETRVIRGGSYNSAALGCVSACIYKYLERGYPPTGTTQSVGLRLCLQDCDLPDFSNGRTIAESAAAGNAAWTPKNTGVYYLTHEIETTDKPAVETASACFEVTGANLTFTPDGDLTPGVGLSIGGIEDGWNVYYTTDGSLPTTSSSLYNGSIILNESGMVNAIAVNTQGVTSDVFTASYTLHDPLGIASAVATPRYPWNGKVDVDVELKGDPSLEYLVALEALDILGGTNLPVRTVAVGRVAPSAPQTMAADGVLNGGCGAHGVRALPGSYRFTWDAAADIAGDFDFARVAVTVKATGSHLLAYPKTLELMVAGYTGTEVLANVPTLVRLSTAIEGFNYADFATTNGADLAFFDANERPLAYEIDEWHTNGESLVWVKLPTLASGTRFTAAWGNSALCVLNSQLAPHEVWRDYAGVWHMNEDSGTAFDSTEHHLDGIPTCGTNRLANVNQMVAYEDGACGRARVNATKERRGGTAMLVPAYDALSLGGRFVVDGWFRGPVVTPKTSYHCRLFGRKFSWLDLDGWEICVTNRFFVDVRGASSASTGAHFNSCVEGWGKVTVAFAPFDGGLYTNGVFCMSVTNEVSATDNGKPLYFGGTIRINEFSSFNGQYDEIRLRGGSLSADRIKADYDMIANREFLSYGAVRAGWEEAVK